MSPVNFNPVNSNNNVYYYGFVNQPQRKQPQINLEPLPTAQQEASIAAPKKVDSAQPNKTDSSDIGLAILGGVLIVGGAALTGVTGPGGVAVMALGLMTLTGCGGIVPESVDDLGNTQNAGPIAITPISGFYQKEYSALGGETVALDDLVFSVSGGPLTGVDRIRVRVGTKNALGTAALSADLNTNIVNVDRESCRVAWAGAQVREQNLPDGTILQDVTLVSENELLANAAVAAWDPILNGPLDGPRSAIVWSGSNTYIYPDALTIDDTNRGSIAPLDIVDAANNPQFMTNGVSWVGLVDTSAGICNPQAPGFAGLPTLWQGKNGAQLLNWNLLATNYGSSLVSPDQLPPSLPIIIDSVMIEIFSNQTGTVAINVPPDQLLVDFDSAQGVYAFDIPEQYWKDFGNIEAKVTIQSHMETTGILGPDEAGKYVVYIDVPVSE